MVTTLEGLVLSSHNCQGKGDRIREQRAMLNTLQPCPVILSWVPWLALLEEVMAASEFQCCLSLCGRERMEACRRLLTLIHMHCFNYVHSDCVPKLNARSEESDLFVICGEIPEIILLPCLL